jgi:hypothetical protein
MKMLAIESSSVDEVVSSILRSVWQEGLKS